MSTLIWSCIFLPVSGQQLGPDLSIMVTHSLDTALKCGSLDIRLKTHCRTETHTVLTIVSLGCSIEAFFRVVYIYIKEEDRSFVWL